MSDQPAGDFRRFLRAAGSLVLGRQLSAALLMVAFLALPNVATKHVVEQTVWPYYAMLTLTSVFVLGLDRLAARLVAERAHQPPARALAPVLLLRFGMVPATAGALSLMFWFVGITVPGGTWVASLVWVVAVQVQLTFFSALRTRGNATVEPSVYMVARLVQAVALIGLAAHDASVTLIVGVLAGADVAGALVAIVSLRGGWLQVERRDWIPRFRWREVGAFGGIDLATLAYLRADLLIVGRLLGPGLGAVYGLAYRVIDGLSGAQNSVNLWLFAETVRRRSERRDTRVLRDRSWTFFPVVAVAVCLALVLSSGLLGVLVPSLRGTVDTLRILLVSVPLLVLSSITLYVRSGLGRNREVLVIGLVVLVANVLLNLWLVSALGLIGAGWALLGSEALQLALVVAAVDESEHALRRRAAVVAMWTALLLVVATALVVELPILAAGAAVLLAGTLATELPPLRRVPIIVR